VSGRVTETALVERKRRVIGTGWQKSGGESSAA